MRRTTWFAGPLVLLAVSPTAAWGATVSASGGGSNATVVFAAAAGEANDVTAAFGSGGVTISDATAPIIAGSGCTAAAPGTVECPAADVIKVVLGDGDDRVISVVTDASPPRRVELLGGEGEDSLIGSFERDLIIGGPGDDEIAAGGGRDIVMEGGDPGEHDSIDGGPEKDELSYAGTTTPVRVDLLAGTGGRRGEDDTISGFEDVTGSEARDVLLGDNGRNRIVDGTGRDSAQRGDRISGRGGRDDLEASGGGSRVDGGAGDDSLGGSPGRNLLVGGPGNDIFQLGTTGQTRLRCGPGVDWFSAFGGPMIVARDCEELHSPYGTIRLRAPGSRLALTFPNRSCKLTLRLGRTGPTKRVGTARGARVAFDLPNRRTGTVALWARSDCYDDPRFSKLFALILN